MDIIIQYFTNRFQRKTNLLVQQKFKYDSEVACIAMFSELSYNTIKTRYFPNYNFDIERIKNVEFQAVMHCMTWVLK
jgi:hypothetical protein